MVPLNYFLVLSGILFAIGTAGVFLRRNLITVLLSIEIMLNAVNLMFVAVGRYRGMAHPVRFGDGPPPAPLPAPTLGQHAREILASLGYTDAEIERLGREGAVIGVDTRATA